MAYGTIAADFVQSSTASVAPVFRDGNSVEIGRMCRAWISFDGTLSSPIAGKASFNMSSITKNSTGNYTFNFAAAFADVNFAGNMTTRNGSIAGISQGTTTTSTMTFLTTNTAGTSTDSTDNGFAAFR
mgnify:CR=1 FL=1